MYNNRHWLTDVVAGAGIGILSVQAAYWLYPPMSRLIFGKRNKGEIVVAPHLSTHDKGLTCVMTF